MHRGLVPDQHPERTPGHLRVDLRALAHCIGGELEQLAPQLRRCVHLEHRERDGPPDLRGQAPHPVELRLGRRDVLARGARARDLEDPAAHLA